MPTRKTAAAGTDAGGQPASPPAARPRARKPATPKPAAEDVLEPTATLTFSEFVGTRPFVPRSDDDQKIQGRSFQIPAGVVERVRATADGIQHMAYGTELEGRVPGSISGFVANALEAACTYWENQLNNGEEFRRVRRLPPGPSAEGAKRGADKRAALRAAKTQS